MAATIEICESNGAGETVSHNITNCNYGNYDDKNLVVATYPITVGNNSYVKYWRYHWNGGSANKIDNLRVWKSAGAYVTGEGIQTNLRTTSYGGAVSYATPVTTTFTDQVFPVADPGGQNIGKGGSLTGYLDADGQYSDYIKSQLQTTGSTPAGNANQKTIIFQYDEQ